MKKAVACLFLSLTPQFLAAANGYLVHNLVADDKTTAPADFYDSRLVNVWGVAPAGQFWVCDLGISTLYAINPTNTTPMGNPSQTTQPAVPGAAGSKGSCSGIVSTGGTPASTPPAYPVTAPGKAAVAANFLFVTEDGVLSAWANGADPTQALVVVDNSKNAVYKGLAITTTPVAQIYAANFKSGAVDVFDTQFKPVTLASGAFQDPAIPSGFAPFNIQTLNNKLYVAYAKQDANKFYDVAGPSNGYVSVYDPSGKLLQHLISGGPGFFGAPGAPLNSPWGIAIAPPSFGKYANALLVGNFGDGLINAFDVNSGVYLGTLQDPKGNNIKIQGLWALAFGRNGNLGDPDTLYFTSGPGGQKHGLLGSISPNPIITSAGVTNSGQAAAGIAPNTYMTIKGTGLAGIKRTWAKSDFGTSGTALPASLDGVTVTLNGTPAYVEYVSPGQITILTPSNLVTAGQIQIAVDDNGLGSSTVNIPAQLLAPAFFLADTAGHISAIHGSGTLIATATPAAPGEVIALYGTGFGSTTPAAVNGQVLATAAALDVAPVITIGGRTANVSFAGLVATGLYQFNVTVPTGLPDGDAPVVATLGAFSTPAGASIAIKN